MQVRRWRQGGQNYRVYLHPKSALRVSLLTVDVLGFLQMHLEDNLDNHLTLAWLALYQVIDNVRYRDIKENSICSITLVQSQQMVINKHNGGRIILRPALWRELAHDMVVLEPGSGAAVNAWNRLPERDIIDLDTVALETRALNEILFAPR